MKTTPIAHPPERLGPFLQGLLARYHRSEFLASDPVQYAHRYQTNADREVVALWCALLAFGNVRAIHHSVENLLARMDPEPARFLASLKPSDADEFFAGFYHRWVTDTDAAALAVSMGRVLSEHGSFGEIAGKAYAETGTASGVMDAIARAVRDRIPGGAASRGLKFLLASPASGSAAKRLAMYLRWMVRADEIDLGLWAERMPRSVLRIPLDTHTSRIARYLGLSTRATVNWKMAEEVTTALARIDPEDPVRFDFALARLGILRDCPHRIQPVKCAPCPIRQVCTLGRAGV